MELKELTVKIEDFPSIKLILNERGLVSIIDREEFNLVQEEREDARLDNEKVIEICNKAFSFCKEQSVDSALVTIFKSQIEVMKDEKHEYKGC